MNNLFFSKISIPIDSEYGSTDLSGLIILNQIFTRIHRAAKGASFAISLPEMNAASESSAATLGNILQLFCADKIQLQNILDNVGVRRLLRDFCEVTPIRPVLPNMIVGWERYIRDRSADKVGLSALRRAQKRLELGKCSANRALPTSGSSTPLKKCDLVLPYFEHMSLTTALDDEDSRVMRVYVRRIENVRPTGFNFDSFGLSRSPDAKNSMHDGSVPVLKLSSRSSA